MAGWMCLQYHITEPSPVGEGAPAAGSRQGKTVLVQLRDVKDPETSERYTIKRYESWKAADGEMWRHETIILKPNNPDFKPIELINAEEGTLKVVAEVVGG